jgi:hypothetical protein
MGQALFSVKEPEECQDRRSPNDRGGQHKGGHSRLACGEHEWMQEHVLIRLLSIFKGGA